MEERSRYTGLVGVLVNLCQYVKIYRTVKVMHLCKAPKIAIVSIKGMKTIALLLQVSIM